MSVNLVTGRCWNGLNSIWFWSTCHILTCIFHWRCLDPPAWWAGLCVHLCHLGQGVRNELNLLPWSSYTVVLVPTAQGWQMPPSCVAIRVALACGMCCHCNCSFFFFCFIVLQGDPSNTLTTPMEVFRATGLSERVLWFPVE